MIPEHTGACRRLRLRHRVGAARPHASSEHEYHDTQAEGVRA